MIRKPSILLLSLLVAPALLGVNVSSISPTSGPASGGTQVTLKGDFSGAGPFKVDFGSIAATSVVKIDAQTLSAVTPAHLPGESTVHVRKGEGFEPGFSLLDFTFEGEVPAAFERILLPLLTPPVRGAFGSEFHTVFDAWNANPMSIANVYGLESSCFICIVPPIPPEKLIDNPVPVLPQSSINETPLFGPIIPSGSPGRFIYVPVAEAKDLATSLRVHDVTRAALNLGTEIPVVREREFVTSEVLALINVPIDPRFRNTLRIYAAGSTDVLVTFISGSGFGVSQQIRRTVRLQPGRHLFEPAFATLSDFPTFLTNPTPITVTIEQPAQNPPPPPMWAFISVTNNETQAITTIAPQR